MNTDPNKPAYSDVAESHDLTAQEKAELDAVIAENTATTTEAAAADQAAADAAKKAADEAAAAQAAADAAAAEAAKAKAAEEATQAAADTAARAAPKLLEVPKAPKDFDAERKTLKQKYDDGDLTADEYADQREALADARSAYNATKAAIEAQNEQATKAHEDLVQADFAAASDAWSKEHAAFIANPIRRQAMQDQINRIDAETKGALSPAELFKQAQAVAFDAFNYTPPAPAAKVDPEQAKRDALRARQSNVEIPPSLANVPAAGIDNGRSGFADLDAGSITDMEAAVARMSGAELEKFLTEVDG